MNLSTKCLPAALLSTFLLSVPAAKAMTFPEFDHMSSDDRQAYLNFMMKSAEQVLNEEGRRDDAAKVYQLFTEISPGSDLSIGEAELETNLANARVHDAEKMSKDPNARRIQVEAALLGTLGKNGIQISPAFVKDFMQLAGTFKPKHSPQTDKK